MGPRTTKPVVERTVVDTTPEGSIRHTAAATAINVNEEYDFPLSLPLGEGGGLFGNNLPRARASLTFEDLSEIRRLQREQYDMFTEDTRSQQRVADARGVIREQNRNLRGGTLFGPGNLTEGLFGAPANIPAGRYDGQALANAEESLAFFRERGRNADRRANEMEITEANAAGRRRRAELDQSRSVRPRI